jgi:hypothetical protein
VHTQYQGAVGPHPGTNISNLPEDYSPPERRLAATGDFVRDATINFERVPEVCFVRQ